MSPPTAPPAGGDESDGLLGEGNQTGVTWEDVAVGAKNATVNGTEHGGDTGKSGFALPLAPPTPPAPRLPKREAGKGTTPGENTKDTGADVPVFAINESGTSALQGAGGEAACTGSLSDPAQCNTWIFAVGGAALCLICCCAAALIRCIMKRRSKGSNAMPEMAKPQSANMHLRDKNEPMIDDDFDLPFDETFDAAVDRAPDMEVNPVMLTLVHDHKREQRRIATEAAVASAQAAAKAKAAKISSGGGNGSSDGKKKKTKVFSHGGGLARLHLEMNNKTDQGRNACNSLKEVESYLEGHKVKDARDQQSGKQRGHEAGEDDEATVHVAQRIAQERRNKRQAARVGALVRLHTRPGGMEFGPKTDACHWS